MQGTPKVPPTDLLRCLFGLLNGLLAADKHITAKRTVVLFDAIQVGPYQVHGRKCTGGDPMSGIGNRKTMEFGQGVRSGRGV